VVVAIRAIRLTLTIPNNASITVRIEAIVKIVSILDLKVFIGIVTPWKYNIPVFCGR
jgi:hypothetical protein